MKESPFVSAKFVKTFLGTNIIYKKLDIDAYGISSVDNEYSGQTKRDMREFLARIKDFFKCIIKPESKYLGEVYNINGNGDKTNK